MCSRASPARRAKLMHERFRKIVEALHPSCENLLATAPVLAAEVPGTTPCGGVYLFSEGDVHL